MAGTTYEMSGKIKVIFEPMSFASGFTKQEFVLILEDDYPQDVKFVCMKDKCGLLNQVAVGNRVTVGFRIRGKEYKERYYVDLDAFRIDKTDVGEDAVLSQEAEALSMMDDPDMPL